MYFLSGPVSRRFNYETAASQPVRRRLLRRDRRAMEGMPFRLVIAVAMGAAAVGLLVPMAEQVEQSKS